MSNAEKTKLQPPQGLARLEPRPRTIYASQGRAVLATDVDGQICGLPRHGLFVRETRVLSRWRYLLQGQAPLPIANSNVEQHSWLGYYAIATPEIQLEKDTGSGQMEPVSEETVELKVSRTIGLGVHEDIDITNFSQETTHLTFEIEVEADFADQAETYERKQHGKCSRQWRQKSDRAGELQFDYRARHRYSHQGNRGVAKISLGMLVQVEKSDSPPAYKNGKLRFALKLGARQSWHACLKLVPVFEGKQMLPLYGCREFFGSRNELDRRRHIFISESTQFELPYSKTLSETVIRALDQAKIDLAALRLADLDKGPRAWVMAAGLPIYVALFGRDTLTASWQAAMISPDPMKGTLYELPKWQGKEVNPWRDEQPGRMLHEAHTGPLAALGYNPRSRYYGAATTSSFYPVVVSELWHWTGDHDLIKPLLGPALQALQWKDRYTELLHDGFYYYQSRSEQGNKNQGWKDSGDAIVYEDGREAQPPISTCEEQAFVYVAKQRMSELLWFMGDRSLARKLWHEAGELKKRFNDCFWMADKKFFALGLDSHRQPIKSITSNPGHLLPCGIAETETAPLVAQRLLQPDMFSGWGVRTLSADHPAFDPYSYHRGSVWPVEHGSFAMGYMRYGLFDELHILARAMFEASGLFQYCRLPECFSGHQRDAEHPFPALYPKTNWPQAWSASSLFIIMQAMLGVYPFAPMNLLLLDPHLPDWLPEITLRNLRVGKAAVDIRFYRKGQATHFDVLEKRGKMRILRQPSPWSLTAGLGERIKDVMESLAA